MGYLVRPIEPGDDTAVEAVIRACLIEYGGDHEGTAWTDLDLGRFSEVYDHEGRAYWVAVDDAGDVVAGCGIGELEGVPGVCELQKMYCLPVARGTGVANELMARALDFARGRYEWCYLETLPNMARAQRFYERHGFERVSEALGSTCHCSCDVRYVRGL